ncbi:MAG: hypothetical protein NTY48_07230, partial [Candidatus Diapherotrites archaeon]|nr:hypothetical protein [Candidatus Diapherotrites archaeon]
SPLILERAFDALALDKKKDSCKTDTIEVKRLLEKMKEIYSSNPLTPFIFEGVLYTADIGKPKEKEFDTINSALNALLLSESGFSSKETKKDFVQKKTKADKTIKDIQIKKAQIEGFEVKEKELQEKGEKIYLHYQEIKELLEAVSKAQKKGIEEKEVMKKINSIRPILKRLDFKKKEAVLTVNK